MSTSGTALLIVDPQNDFHPGGSLAIPGADTDAERIASLITQHGGNIDEIFVTLDSHHKMDIAHPKFWKNSEGFAPSPFTLITTEDIIAGRWVPVQDQYLVQYIHLQLTFGHLFIYRSTTINTKCNVSLFLYASHVENPFEEYCKTYTQQLEEGGHFTLCIWPEHCLV
ncbi:unnamed protein product, partial [Choristocarpus tenellus]